MMKKVLLAGLLLSALGTQAAVQRIQLPLQDEHLRGESTIKLKQLLKAQTGKTAKGLELLRVAIVAKSKKGHGKVHLTVGQDDSLKEIIDGRPYDFDDSHRSTFSRIVLRNPALSSQGVWQLKLKGNIKVRKVVLIVDEKRQQPPLPQIVTKELRTFKVSKWIETERHIQLPTKQIKAIKIKADNNTTVLEASLVLSNGRVIDLPRLEGVLRKGVEEAVKLNANQGAKATTLRIKAVSNNLRGSRAQMTVSVDMEK
ncbi:hypothetical protein HBN50_05905 [Halobacteriovorax sp. GB3]|uniref:hypothetical protein n=1 Tax=Halobacteriovorax sp. GB3 TaxID=2719615 RepID=UPI0023608C3B|nr:hypothetical protein [Halobacteriovorax sp. GB3]MDD0852620.1 hypothetical protein [Halobacteriovorax sp. GB3]